MSEQLDLFPQEELQQQEAGSIEMPEEKIITDKDSEVLAFSIMSDLQRKKFLEEKEIDFS